MKVGVPINLSADPSNFGDKIAMEVRPNWGASASVTVGFNTFMRLVKDFHFIWWSLTEEQREQFKNECQKIVDAPMMRDFETQ